MFLEKITKTTLPIVAETDLLLDSSISHSRMSICQPANHVSTTPVPWRHAWCRHPGSRSSLKTIPAFSNAVVTIPVVGSVSYFPVCGSKALVVLTFWEKKWDWNEACQIFDGIVASNHQRSWEGGYFDFSLFLLFLFFFTLISLNSTTLFIA